MLEKFSKPSAILSIVCALTLFLSYELAPEKPEGWIVIILQLLFFTSLITGVISLVLSFLAHRNKEKGFLKNVAPTILVVILAVFALAFIGIIVSFI
ncbi:hypothetical protein ACOJQI_12275 [Bacillus salacetis]|uniref:hypothetical protein n=1 Tax=Bacillus salacetis TaxID=2315464 RepID=UPI003BA190B7